MSRGWASVPEAREQSGKLSHRRRPESICLWPCRDSGLIPPHPGEPRSLCRPVLPLSKVLFYGELPCHFWGHCYIVSDAWVSAILHTPCSQPTQVQAARPFLTVSFQILQELRKLPKRLSHASERSSLPPRSELFTGLQLFCCRAGHV